MGTIRGGNREDNTLLVVRTPKSENSYGPRPKLVMVDRILKHVPLLSVIDSKRFASLIFWDLSKVSAYDGLSNSKSGQLAFRSLERFFPTHWRAISSYLVASNSYIGLIHLF
jgi:hypothetical protein